MSDGVVQVPADSTGKKIDTSEVTRNDGTTVVERQRVVATDPNLLDMAAQMAVAAGRAASDDYWTALIYAELVRIRIGISQMAQMDLSAIDPLNRS